MDRTTVVGDQFETVVYMVYASIDSTTVIRGLMFQDGGDAGTTIDTASSLVDSCAVESARGGQGIFCLDGSQAII